MSATATKPDSRNGQAPRLNRDQVAETILQDVLTDAPQSEAAIRRAILGPNQPSRGSSDVVRGALGVLEARRQAMKVPMRPGLKNLGWVRYTTKKAAQVAETAGPPEEIKFPYMWAMVDVSEMFIDTDYQRPLTGFVEKIQAQFKPWLFQTLAISDRGSKNRPHRYAIIDGQTRWTAARRLNIGQVPCTVFKGLKPEDEAEIFAQLQKERRGILSYHRFRAAVAAKKPEALAIKKIAEEAGYKLGEDTGQLKAVAALERIYRVAPDLLERVLTVLRETWTEEAPEADHIRGLGYLYQHYPLNKKGYKDVDDELLVRRMKAAGKDGLKSKMHAAKAAALDGKGSNSMWMAHAMQMVYDAKR